jgi:large subunit ribosomal protein L18e
MVKSKTKIENQLKKKTNSELVETIVLCKKNAGWKEVASILSGSSRNRINKNLEEIEKEAKEGEIILIPGKVLSGGELNKKIRLIGFSFSEKALEKLKKNKIENSLIIEEVKKNKDAKGVRILK